MKRSNLRAGSVILFIAGMFLFLPDHGYAQIVSMSILDLRTKHVNHPWSFHPGDSPLVEQRAAAGAEIIDEETQTGSVPALEFAWARPELAEQDAGGWIDDIPIQLAWSRYRDASGNRPFRDFSDYARQYRGYGWYRTSFTVSKEDLARKFKSRRLVLRLGVIGQADAVYLNGSYIGGTGLRPNTPQGKQLRDEKLFYSKMRFYDIPRELLRFGEANVIAVRTYAKYNIAPGLSHGKYYIASAKKIERSRFWDHFKKISVIVMSVLLGIFYLYWQVLFRENDRASVYFALACFAMALNTFMQSQIVYSMLGNALWIKKIEFISLVIFIHLLLEFIVHFTRIDTSAIRIINRVWEAAGAAAVIALACLSTLITAQRFMFAWSALPALMFIYIIWLLVKGRKVPSMTAISIGFIGLAVALVNDVLVNAQFFWVTWEFTLKDQAFAFFALAAAASIVSNMKKTRELVQQQKAEKERLSKYFSPDVVDHILAGEISLGGQEKNIVTLFADIVGFTSYSEKHSPAEVVERLNELFTRISEKIFGYRATLDKYIGDCVMAFWGAPQPTDRDAYNAVACALEMQKVCDEINATLPAGENPFKLRIGINYGPSIVGNIGSHERMDYTVIGDAVNTASRIESNGVPGKVAISEATFRAAGGAEVVSFSETRQITVKGKTEPLTIYIVDGIR